MSELSYIKMIRHNLISNVIANIFMYAAILSCITAVIGGITSIVLGIWTNIGFAKQLFITSLLLIVIAAISGLTYVIFGEECSYYSDKELEEAKKKATDVYINQWIMRDYIVTVSIKRVERKEQQK